MMARRLEGVLQWSYSQDDEDTMKTKSLLLVLALLSLLLVGTASATPGIGVSFGVFYSNLSGYGEWIDVDGGTYAWRPRHMADDWRPYWAGRWLWTDDGWYWDSDEPWAWATYHYGRWYYDDYYGWIWVPGYDWAPAWVEWRYGGDYIGWAPLSPYAVFNASFGIHYLRHWVTPYHYWAFVDCRYLTHHNVHEYVYRRENNTRFIGRTRTGGSVRYEDGRIITRGPDVGNVERRGNVRIERSQIVDVNGRDEVRVRRVGERDQIGVYRPRIEERNPDNGSDRPPVIGRQERVPSLDTRSLDVRQRQGAREEGRDVNRVDQYRVPRGERREQGTDGPAVRDYRTPAPSQSTPGGQAAPAERSRRLDRGDRPAWNSNRGDNSEHRTPPSFDRPSSHTAPEGRSATRSGRSGGGERSSSSGRSSGGGRDRR
jgi:hypothetical protein